MVKRGCVGGEAGEGKGRKEMGGVGYGYLLYRSSFR